MKRTNTDSDEKMKLLLKVLDCALVEIRYLSWHGNAKQAGDLADALHNLPKTLIYRNYHGINTIIDELCSYQATYHTKDYAGKFDYVAILKRIDFKLN